MDKLDVAVVRELFQGKPTSPTRPEVVLSYRTIGRRLGVSGETVRTRAKKLVESGFIQGWTPHPNPKLLGLKVGYAMFDVNGVDKDKAVRQFRLIDGTILVINYHGGAIGTVFFYSDQKSLSDRIALLRSITEGVNYGGGEILYPPCDIEMSPLDWRVLAALQRGPTRPYAELARELGVSTRTVKRRVTRMTGSGALFFLASGDETRLKDTLRADFFVKWGATQARAAAQQELLTLLNDYVFFVSFGENFAFFNMLVPSTATAGELLRKAAAVKGVDEARMEFSVGRHESYGVFNDLVRKRVRELGRN